VCVVVAVGSVQCANVVTGESAATKRKITSPHHRDAR